LFKNEGMYWKLFQNEGVYWNFSTIKECIRNSSKMKKFTGSLNEGHVLKMLCRSLDGRRADHPAQTRSHL